MRFLDQAEIKMVNAIMYFAGNVKYPYKVKIFKLLNFLDFDHFKQVGIPVTNQTYRALDYGPIPEDLNRRIKEKNLSEYFNDNIKIIPWQSGGREGYEFKPRKKPDMEVFTPRELEIMKNLVLKFKNVKAEEISEVSHLKNTPWERTERYKEIDYFLVLDDEDADVDKDSAEERYKSCRRVREIFGGG